MNWTNLFTFWYSFLCSEKFRTTMLIWTKMKLWTYVNQRKVKIDARSARVCEKQIRSGIFRDELNTERIYKWMIHKCSSYNTHRGIRIRNIVECYLQYRAHVHSSCGKHLDYSQFYAGFASAHNIELCPVWIGPDWPWCRPYRSSIVYTGVISSLQKKHSWL